MLALILIFLLMAGLLSFGWQWPYLLGLDGRLELLLRGSWLASISLPGLALSWFVLRRPLYVGMWVTWLAFGFVTLAATGTFRAVELVGQIALLALWCEACIMAGGWSERVVAGIAATVHLWMAAWGAVAKVLDPGWMPDSPDVLMRVYGPWTAFLYVVPAAAIIGVSWLVGRRE